MAVAPATETASMAEAAATPMAEAAAVVGWRRHWQGNIGITMIATTSNKAFDPG